MNISPINNNQNTSFGKIRVLKDTPEVYKELFYKSAFSRDKEQYLAIPYTKKTDLDSLFYDANSTIYRFKIVKMPKTFLGKQLLKLGLYPGKYLTKGYHSEYGTERALHPEHVDFIKKRVPASISTYCAKLFHRIPGLASRQ